MKSLYVIDASGYLYRSYFAIQGMTNKEGESTGALFGFIRSILKLIQDFHPDHIVATFDGPKGTIKRKEIYPDYKANRTETPQDLRYQIDWAKEFCELMGIPLLNIPEVEADDTMGSVAVWGKEQGANVYLCTSDKDMAQLVNEHIYILNTHKDNLLLDAAKVEEVYGVPPRKIIDFLAITGDSSDNVPGISGFGPKTAVTLLQQFDSLDEILDNPDQVKGAKKQETLRNERDKALLSRKLVTIDTEVPFEKTSDFFSLKNPDIQSLKKFYAKMDFHSLLKEIDSNGGKEEVAYYLVDDEKSFQELISHLAKQTEICFDTETTEPHPMQAELVGIGFTTEPGKGWYVPVNGKLGLDYVLQGVKPLFENPNIGFYAHNAKYDWHVMKNYEITIPNLCFDTILASYVLNSHSRQHSLDTLALEYFGKVKIPITDLIGKGKKQVTMREVPIEQVCEYCCEDVDYTCRLKLKLEEELKERKLEKVFFGIELPLLPILAKMERRGIFLDVPTLKKMSATLIESLTDLQDEIYGMAEEKFNLNSPKQLIEILYTKMEIKCPRKKVSTSADVLEEIEHPIAEKILEYRKLEKLRSTYIDTLPHQVNPKTNRIHPTFNQSVAATGRLSCTDPNLQNIPVRTELGKQIREAFRPEKENWSYLSADYSQIELRLVAHFSEDPTMMQAFLEGEDIHAHTAANIFHVPLKEVTKEQRYRAKAVNFGIIYGQGGFGLGRQLGIDIKEASEFIELYFQKYPKVKEFLESCKEKSRESGIAVTAYGRERAIPEITSKNPMIRSAAERLAINTPLQGTAADLIKVAMIQLDDHLKSHPLKGEMILQIHDELIFEIPNDEISSWEPLVKEKMEKVLDLKVPLVVNISLGKNWREC